MSVLKFSASVVVYMKGVKLGDNCVVGTKALVIKSFSISYTIAGVSAQLIRKG